MLGILEAVLLLGLRADAGVLDKTLFIAPADGHKPVVDAIDHAVKSVQMTMYHLTDLDVIDALAGARKRKLDVRVILDGESLKKPRFAAGAQALTAAGVLVRPSSPAFSITHEKALLIDGTKAVIMSMNMTQTASDTRDYGIITENPGIVAEWESVFNADWMNAQTGRGETPRVHRADLLWSPVNSEKKLKDLALRARKELAVEVENLGDKTIMKALIKAAKRRASVRVIVPMCDLNADPLYNYPFLAELAKAGVQVKVMSYPSYPDEPYMHAKMMLADRSWAYVGSVNFSENSTRRARELGILFSEQDLLARLADTFERDWRAAVDVPDPPPRSCPRAQ